MVNLHRRSPASAPHSRNAPDQAPATTAAHTPPRTRAGTTWVLACIAALVLIALIVFLAQNSGATKISFFSLHGRFPLAVALLAAAVAGCLLTLMIGSTRILQLRRVVRRRRRDDRIAAARTAPPQTAGIEPGAPRPQNPSREQAEGASSNGRVSP